MAQQEHMAIEETRMNIAQEAHRHIENARAEEAWTAQQTLIQVEASANAEAQMVNLRMRQVEMQAEKAIAEESRVANHEVLRTQNIIGEARSWISQKENAINVQENEIMRLRHELETARKQNDEIKRKDLHKKDLLTAKGSNECTRKLAQRRRKKPKSEKSKWKKEW